MGSIYTYAILTIIVFLTISWLLQRRFVAVMAEMELEIAPHGKGASDFLQQLLARGAKVELAGVTADIIHLPNLYSLVTVAELATTQLHPRVTSLGKATQFFLQLVQFGAWLTVFVAIVAGLSQPVVTATLAILLVTAPLLFLVNILQNLLTVRLLAKFWQEIPTPAAGTFQQFVLLDGLATSFGVFAAIMEVLYFLGLRRE